MPVMKRVNGLFIVEEPKREPQPYHELFSPDRPSRSVEECEHVDDGHIDKPAHCRVGPAEKRGKKYVYRCKFCGAELIYATEQETLT